MPHTIIYRPPFRKRGQNPYFYGRPLNKGDITGSGGVTCGGAATVAFGHTGQVPSNIVVEWDFDNDGDFSEAVEDITSYVLSLETFTGRDWPSNLTGKAGPGKLRMTLLNQDNRFSYFNASSPLNQAPFSLKTGRKVRVRTAESSITDPALLARDRFRRANGALGSEEGGIAYSEPLANDFVIESESAVPSSEGSSHMALLDIGEADYYVQCTVSVLGFASNSIGLVYRYVDTSNYSLLTINATTGAVQAIDVVSGVQIPVVGVSLEKYSGITLGALVSGGNVTVYVEGVAVATGDAPNTTSTVVGIYALWATDNVRPEFQNFYAWDGLPTTQTGVLWTGDISELVSAVEAGPYKLATVSGEGYLSRLSAQRVIPPSSSTGRSTGYLIGNILADAELLHPPGEIAKGDIVTGPFTIDPTSGIEAARQVEETEYGFLYETQEGPIAFQSRSGRDGALSQVTFSDATDTQFSYSFLRPYDWRREVFNRVTAGVSPWSEGAEDDLYSNPGPYTLSSGQTVSLTATYDGSIVQWTGHSRTVAIPSAPSGISVTGDANTTAGVAIEMPAVINAGDLLIVVGHYLESAPSGWTALSTNFPGVWAKVADGTEGGTTVSNAADQYAYQVYRITSWHGSLDGVKVSSVDFSGSSANPPGMSVPWGTQPTLYIAVASLQVNTAASDGTASASVTYPSGYSNGVEEHDNGSGFGDLLWSARKESSTGSEDPGTMTGSLTSQTSPFYGSITIAVRGSSTGSETTVEEGTPSGTNPTFTIGYVNSIGGSQQTHSDIVVTGIPLLRGDTIQIQADNYDSQDDHNAIRTYVNSADLFASNADAQEYAELVLSTHADDRPILSIGFFATKSGAYRKQALQRRIGDKITLIANNNAGLGIAQDFFIESINHRFSNGNRLWEVTWELSPA